MARRNIEDYWFKTRQYLLAGVTFLSSVVSAQPRNPNIIENDDYSPNIEKVAIPNSEVTPAPTCMVDFQNDTVYSNKGVAGTFSPSTKTTTIYIEEDYRYSKTQLRSSKVHEHKHRRNNLAGFGELNMSLEETYKAGCLNEISANLEDLIDLRQQYIEAKSDAERREMINEQSRAFSRFGFYFIALKEGKINPFTLNPEEFEQEMRFIGQELQNNWMISDVKEYDKGQFMHHMILYFYEHDYDELKPNPENYQKARQIALGNIGGLDFTKYMDDIECYNPHIKEADKLIASDCPRDQVGRYIIAANVDTSVDVTLSQYEQLYYLKKMSEDLREAVAEIKQVKAYWNTCHDDLEKMNVERPQSLLAQKWFNDVSFNLFSSKEGLSLSEVKFLQDACFYEPDYGSQFDINLLKKYYYHKGHQHLQEIAQNGEADKNYEAKIKELFTIDGIDFFPYHRPLYSNNPHIAELDKKLQEPNEIDWWYFSEFEPNSEIKIPEIVFNDDLSPMEQFRIAQHQMFIENALLRTPGLYKVHKIHQEDFRYRNGIVFNKLPDLISELKYKNTMLKYDFMDMFDDCFSKFERAEDYDIEIPLKPVIYSDETDDVSAEDIIDDIDFNFDLEPINPFGETNMLLRPELTPTEQIVHEALEGFRKSLQDNEDLRYEWAKQENKLIFQIATHYKTKLFMPEENSEKYNQALAQVYTVGDFDITPYYQVETLIPKSSPRELENVTKISFGERLYNCFVQIKDAFKNIFKKEKIQDETPKSSLFDDETVNSDYRKKSSEPNYHHELDSIPVEERYDTEWSPEHRVSPVMYEEIYDLSQPFLREHYEELVQRADKIESISRRKENVRNLSALKKQIKKSRLTEKNTLKKASRTSKGRGGVSDTGITLE